jgi:formate dehydrogenase beta subunit
VSRSLVPGVEARAGKFPGPSLIPALNAIQARLGWLPREELEELARETRRPRYEIEGLISFYPHFRTTPPRPVALHVCHDLPCFLRGGKERLTELRERYGADADVELIEVSCLGRCDTAPAVAVNERPAPVGDADALVAAARRQAGSNGTGPHATAPPAEP